MVNSAAQALKGHDYAAANRRALSHLFEEYDRARAERDAAEERLNRFAETIKLMMEGLPPGERQDYQRRFEELRDRAPVQNRGGAVYANVVELFKSHPPRPWNAAEIQDALEKEGKAAPDTKAIHNTLTYLARAGHIERISRGRYVLRAWGVSIDTPSANDFDLPSAGGARITEHDV